MVNKKRTPPMLDAPIPGQSLTAEPGSRPWEKPAKYATPEEAAQFYIENLSQPKKMASLLDKIEEGAPLTLIADTLQTLGVSKGLHSLDVGILVTPVIIEFMKASAEQAEVDYTVGIEEDDELDSVDETTAKSIAAELFKEKRPVEMLLEEKDKTPEVADASEDGMESVAEEGEAPRMERKGLMARKKEVERDGV